MWKLYRSLKIRGIKEFFKVLILFRAIRLEFHKIGGATWKRRLKKLLKFDI